MRERVRRNLGTRIRRKENAVRRERAEYEPGESLKCTSWFSSINHLFQTWTKLTSPINLLHNRRKFENWVITTCSLQGIFIYTVCLHLVLACILPCQEFTFYFALSTIYLVFALSGIFLVFCPVRYITCIFPCQVYTLYFPLSCIYLVIYPVRYLPCILPCHFSTLYFFLPSICFVICPARYSPCNLPCQVFSL